MESTGGSITRRQPSSHGAQAVGTLVLFYGVQSLDNQIVGKLAPAIAEHFGQPLESMAWAFTAHQAGLAFGAVLGGLVGDRLNRRVIVLTCLLGASVLAFLVPNAQSLAAFAAIRAGSGLIIGIALPSALALVAAIATDSWRSIAVTFALAGASIGSAFGSLVTTQVGDWFEWRAVFRVDAGALLIVFVLIAAVVRDSSSGKTRAQLTARTGLTSPLRLDLVMLSVAFMLTIGVNALINAWLPGFFSALADVPLQDFAGVAAYATPVAIVGMVGAGWLSRKFAMKSLALLCFGLYGVALIAIGSLAFGSVAFSLALAATFGSQAACGAVLNLSVVSRFPDELRARALGITAAVGRGGAIVAPMFGALALKSGLSMPVFFALIAVPLMVVAALLLLLESKWPQKNGYTSVG